MREQAAETERRTDGYIDTLEGRKTAIREKARETKSEAVDMMKTYLEGEEEALDGFEFLSMAEAGELCHWEIVQVIADTVGDTDASRTLADWAVDVQRRHVEGVRKAYLALAAEEAKEMTVGLRRLVRIAGEGEPEGVALAAAVLGQHLAERPLQLGDERRAVLG